eukprot:Filipodium_phascolosomae@DN347_c0_g1_i1.p1
MVDIWDGPPREGVRGGQEHFKWDHIKDQSYRDRECYLGYSTKLGQTGKFGRFYKNDWWQKKRDNATTIQEEFQTIKTFEDELMSEALGLKPKKLLLLKHQMTEEQRKEIFKKPDQSETQQTEADNEVQGVFAKGLGYAPHRTHEFIAPPEKLEGTGVDLTKAEEDSTKLGFDSIKKEEAAAAAAPTVSIIKEEPHSSEEEGALDAQDSLAERHIRKKLRKQEKKEKRERKERRQQNKLIKSEPEDDRNRVGSHTHYKSVNDSYHNRRHSRDDRGRNQPRYRRDDSSDRPQRNSGRADRDNSRAERDNSRAERDNSRAERSRATTDRSRSRGRSGRERRQSGDEDYRRR